MSELAVHHDQMKTARSVDYHGRYLPDQMPADMARFTAMRGAVWQGGGAKALNIEGKPVLKADYYGLFNDLKIPGSAAILDARRAAANQRIKGSEFEVRMPKVISVMWALADTPEKREIMLKIAENVGHRTAGYIEENAVYRQPKTATMAAERTAKAAGILYTTHLHVSSRPTSDGRNIQDIGRFLGRIAGRTKQAPTWGEMKYLTELMVEYSGKSVKRISDRLEKYGKKPADETSDVKAEVAAEMASRLQELFAQKEGLKSARDYGDPHLHMHITVGNYVLAKDGKWRSGGWSERLFKNEKMVDIQGMVDQFCIEELMKAGFEIRPQGARGWTVGEVGDTLKKFYSSRGEEVREATREMGLNPDDPQTAKTRQMLVFLTRQEKGVDGDAPAKWVIADAQRSMNNFLRKMAGRNKQDPTYQEEQLLIEVARFYKVARPEGTGRREVAAKLAARIQNMIRVRREEENEHTKFLATLMMRRDTRPTAPEQEMLRELAARYNVAINAPLNERAEFSRRGAASIAANIQREISRTRGTVDPAERTLLTTLITRHNASIDEQEKLRMLADAYGVEYDEFNMQDHRIAAVLAARVQAKILAPTFVGDTHREFVVEMMQNDFYVQADGYGLHHTKNERDKQLVERLLHGLTERTERPYNRDEMIERALTGLETPLDPALRPKLEKLADWWKFTHGTPNPTLGELMREGIRRLSEDQQKYPGQKQTTHERVKRYILDTASSKGVVVNLAELESAIDGELVKANMLESNLPLAEQQEMLDAKSEVMEEITARKGTCNPLIRNLAVSIKAEGAAEKSSEIPSFRGALFKIVQAVVAEKIARGKHKKPETAEGIAALKEKIKKDQQRLYALVQDTMRELAVNLHGVMAIESPTREMQAPLLAVIEKAMQESGRKITTVQLPQDVEKREAALATLREQTYKSGDVVMLSNSEYLPPDAFRDLAKELRNSGARLLLCSTPQSVEALKLPSMVSRVPLTRSVIINEPVTGLRREDASKTLVNGEALAETLEPGTHWTIHKVDAVRHQISLKNGEAMAVIPYEENRARLTLEAPFRTRQAQDPFKLLEEVGLSPIRHYPHDAENKKMKELFGKIKGHKTLNGLSGLESIGKVEALGDTAETRYADLARHYWEQLATAEKEHPNRRHDSRVQVVTAPEFSATESDLLLKALRGHAAEQGLIAKTSKLTNRYTEKREALSQQKDVAEIGTIVHFSAARIAQIRAANEFIPLPEPGIEYRIHEIKNGTLELTKGTKTVRLEEAEKAEKITLPLEFWENGRFVYKQNTNQLGLNKTSGLNYSTLTASAKEGDTIRFSAADLAAMRQADRKAVLPQQDVEYKVTSLDDKHVWISLEGARSISIPRELPVQKVAYTQNDVLIANNNFRMTDDRGNSILMERGTPYKIKAIADGNITLGFKDETGRGKGSFTFSLSELEEKHGDKLKCYTAERKAVADGERLRLTRSQTLTMAKMDKGYVTGERIQFSAEDMSSIPKSKKMPAAGVQYKVSKVFEDRYEISQPFSDEDKKDINLYKTKQKIELTGPISAWRSENGGTAKYTVVNDPKWEIYHIDKASNQIHLHPVGKPSECIAIDVRGEETAQFNTSAPGFSISRTHAPSKGRKELDKDALVTVKKIEDSGRMIVDYQGEEFFLPAHSGGWDYAYITPQEKLRADKKLATMLAVTPPQEIGQPEPLRWIKDIASNLGQELLCFLPANLNPTTLASAEEENHRRVHHHNGKNGNGHHPAQQARADALDIPTPPRPGGGPESTQQPAR